VIARRDWPRPVRAVALALVLHAGAAMAGQTCEPFVPTPSAVAKGFELARRTRDALDATGAEVVLIARAGQDLTRYHLRYSHMGFAWRDHPDGRWTVVHELNDCGSASSALHDEGLANFFFDDPFRYEAVVVVPDTDMQHRLAALLAGRQPQALHENRYNVVAYPFSTAYQNSNQWVLELWAVAAADDPLVDDRDSAQRWLKSHEYRPTTLDIPATERLGARLFRANVAFDDHPFDRRLAGQIDAVSVESVIAFVRRQSTATRVQVIGRDDDPSRKQGAS
jgi:hypothetical protein